jgi:hypothetical protein
MKSNERIIHLPKRTLSEKYWFAVDQPKDKTEGRLKIANLVSYIEDKIDITSGVTFTLSHTASDNGKVVTYDSVNSSLEYRTNAEFLRDIWETGTDTYIPVFNSEGLFNDTNTIYDSGFFKHPDAYGSIYGDDDDLWIYHNGSHGYIDNVTGSLYIRQNNDNTAVLSDLYLTLDRLVQLNTNVASTPSEMLVLNADGITLEQYAFSSLPSSFKLANEEWLLGTDHGGNDINILQVDTDDTLNFGLPVNISSLRVLPDSGSVPIVYMGVTSDSNYGDEMSLSLWIADKCFKVYTTTDGAGGIDDLELYINGSKLAVGDLDDMSSADLLAVVTDETGTGLLVFNDTPTLLTPTIADFTNATHDHSDASNGGTIDHTDLTNLNSASYYHLTNTQYTDLTDSGDSTLHYHATDRDRANHTGTQIASTISDFDTEVSNNTDVAANTTARHAAATIADTLSINMSITGQQISGVVLPAGVDHDSLLNFVSNEHIDWTAAADNFKTTGSLAVGGVIGSWQAWIYGNTRIDGGLYIHSDESGKEAYRITIDATDGDALRIYSWDTTGTVYLPMRIGGQADNTSGITFDADAALVTIDSSGIGVDGNLRATITNATSDTDKFVVDDSGELKYRTGAEMLSDLGISSIATMFDLNDAYEIDALYPLNIASLRILPDSGIVTIADMGVTSDSSYGDEMGFQLMVEGNALKYYGLADGAGGVTDLSLTIDGDISADNLNITNWDTAYTHAGLTNNPHTVTKAQVGLTDVEDVALSTWIGTINITTLGTITTGIWSGTALVAGKVPNHDNLNGYVANEHIDWTGASDNLYTSGYGRFGSVKTYWDSGYAFLESLSGGVKIKTQATSAPLIGVQATNNAFLWDGSGDFTLYRAGASYISSDATGISLISGASINEFSIDGTLAGDSDTAVPTEKAVKGYVDDKILTIKKSISAADLNTAFAFPVEVIPQPGPNKIIQIIAVVSQLTYSSPAYNNIDCYLYSNGVLSPSMQYQFLIEGVAINGSSSERGILPTNTNYTYNVPSNASILFKPDSDLNAGGGSLQLFITYRIIDIS